MRVHVYWNLHKDCYSVRAAEGPHKGRVIAYRDSVALRDARFHVSAKGRARVVANRCKLVHAWIIGTLIDAPLPCAQGRGGFVGVTYNPYRDASFVRRIDGERVSAAAQVVCNTINGKAAVSAERTVS